MLRANELRHLRLFLCEKSFKKSANKFGGKEKSRTFAIPITKEALSKRVFQVNGRNKFIEKTEKQYNKYKQVPRIQLIEKR